MSFGMTELDEKESQNPDESGWGFEFTFRLTRRPEEHEAPVWPVGFLQNLARYVYSSGNWFEAGDHVDACPAIADALVNRLPHGRTLTISGDGRSITFSPSDSDSGGAALDEGVLTLDLLPTELSALVAALHNTSPGPLPIRPQLVIAFDHET
ncbi:suppressor of fused domain protein [Nocardia sp. NPDC055049]